MKVISVVVSSLATYEAHSQEARSFSEIRLLNRSVLIYIDGMDKFNVVTIAFCYHRTSLVVLNILRVISLSSFLRLVCLVWLTGLPISCLIVILQNYVLLKLLLNNSICACGRNG